MGTEAAERTAQAIAETQAAATQAMQAIAEAQAAAAKAMQAAQTAPAVQAAQATQAAPAAKAAKAKAAKAKPAAQATQAVQAAQAAPATQAVKAIAKAGQAAKATQATPAGKAAPAAKAAAAQATPATQAVQAAAAQATPAAAKAEPATQATPAAKAVAAAKATQAAQAATATKAAQAATATKAVQAEKAGQAAAKATPAAPATKATQTVQAAPAEPAVKATQAEKAAKTAQATQAATQTEPAAKATKATPAAQAVPATKAAKAELATQAANEQMKHGKNVLLKYLIAELLLYFIIAFLFFFLIFFVNQILLVAENILKMRVPLKNVALLIVYSMPFIVAQAAPFATLVGFLVCLGRLVTENEILIFRASGHSYSLLLVPVLLLGLFISMISFVVNDYLLPLATVAYSDLYRRIAVSNPGVELEPHSVKRTNESTLVIGDVSGKTVSDLVFFDVDTNNSWRVIVASNTLVTQAQDKSVLMQLEMRDAVVVLFDIADKTTYDVIMSGEVRMNIFNSTIFPPLPVPNPREMPARTLWGRILEMRQVEDTSPQQINIYELEFHKKFSLPFASVFFALMALPFAILFGSHNGQTIGFVFGIIVCVVYWAMMILGQIFSGNNGFNGALSMWLPNALVGVVGLVCLIGLRQK